MRAARSCEMASEACASPRAATLATVPVGTALPSTAAAQASRTVEGPSCSRRSMRPLPLTADARSRSSGMLSWFGLSPWSRPFMANSTTSKGFPAVIAQHSRQNMSSAPEPRASRTMRATAPVVSGASSCGRVPRRAMSARRNAASAGISSGLHATMISMASSSARAANDVSQARDSASAQCASSRTSTTGALRTESWVTTQSRPSRTPCGSGAVGPWAAAVRPSAGATMSYQAPSDSRRSPSVMAAYAGWMSWRMTWNGTCFSCSPPRAKSTVQPRSAACRRASANRVVLPMPADPAKVRTPPRRVAEPRSDPPHRSSTARWIARISDSRSSRGRDAPPLGSAAYDILVAPSCACGRVYGPGGRDVLDSSCIPASRHSCECNAVPSAHDGAHR